MQEQVVQSPLNTGWKAEFQDILQQTRNHTLWGGMVLLVIVGALVIMNSSSSGNPYWYSTAVLVGYACTLIAFLIQKRFPFFAAWFISMGLLGMAVILTGKAGITESLNLLILSVGFIALCLGARQGLLLASACTIALLFLNNSALLTISSFQLSMLVLLMWVVVVLVWMLVRSLAYVIGWAWEGYRTSVVSLREARNMQGQLVDSLENLKEANEQLNRLNQLAQNLRFIAEEERRIKEEFVANVSHELRTPLNMIVGFCGMILQSPYHYNQPVPPKLLVDLEIIYRNSQHLSSLIDDVLDLSQVDAGKMALVKEKTSIVEIINEAVVAVRPLYETKGLYINVVVPDNLPLIWVDRTRIREVLMNLLSNAGRFTEEGGISLRASQKDGYLVVSVADTGPGMTTDEKNRLFRPFEQLDSSIRRRYGGTGLGLSISKSFVEMHEGSIWVESKKNEGTTFYFQLPFDLTSFPAGGPVRWLNVYERYEDRRHYHLEKNEIVRPRMLVVEKGEVMQKLLARYFPSMDVAICPTLDDALKRIEAENAIALLVNDPMVSNALDLLRESGRLPFGIPAIVCSIAGEEQASAEFGVENYLVKPIRREVLLDAIDRLNRPIQTILVVDDEPDARQLFKRMLESAQEHSYQVVRAEDGEAALEELKARPIDLILLDISMPNLNGFQFLAIKNESKAWKDIPVILISARDPYGHPITSSALGVTYGNGLSTRQVLACIESLTGILAPVASGSRVVPEVPAA
jgi:signal transduction histidine kinase/DNA-binding response OmpR family regulator